jgi:hypothetical protein
VVFLASSGPANSWLSYAAACGYPYSQAISAIAGDAAIAFCERIECLSSARKKSFQALVHISGR